MLSNFFRSLFNTRPKPQVGDIWYFISDRGWKAEKRIRAQIVEINSVTGHIKYSYINDDGIVNHNTTSTHSPSMGDIWILESPADLNK